MNYFGRKIREPREVGQLRTDYAPPDHLQLVHAVDDMTERLKTESEPRPCTCHPDDNPPVPCAQKYALSECKASVADRLNPIDEIATLLRTLTWREMMDLSEAWNTPADTLWKWSRERE